jgi:hypothetical protein
MERIVALSLSNNEIMRAFPQLRVSLQQAGLTTIKDIAKTSPQIILEATGLSIPDSEDLCKTALSEIQNNGLGNLFIKATNISPDKERGFQQDLKVLMNF